MSSELIRKYDELFKSYNYDVADSSTNQVRVYTLRYGMYHAAELLLVDKNFDPTEIKNDYSQLGYATNIHKLDSNVDLDEYLFEGFFIKTPLGNELKRRYQKFVSKQLKNLPENSKYKFIECSYDVLLQDDERALIEQKSFSGTEDVSLIDKINTLLSNTQGALLIVLEAAAGFGKTCTAHEILNTFSSTDSRKLPFFTELSRNREARIFKYILLNEIDEQFPNGIKQNIVIEQITKGRIPLIIDGFDELITKESNKEEVESMLTTIIELLKGEAKIIITSRKTALFNSEEFLNTIDLTTNSFHLARIEIKEPTISNWLVPDRENVLKESNFPIEQVANPVLLAYLRNIPLDKLKDYVSNSSEESLIDKYVTYLLTREQERQNLKLTPDDQLRIYRKLVRFMSEYNFTAETKETIKEFISEYNIKLLQKSLNDYTATEKPSIQDLVETLSNHVFLDKKTNNSIGIVNDFIFGLLIGENLVHGKFQEHYPDNFYKIIPQDFAHKALQSFKVQPKKLKNKFWDVFSESEFPYDVNFYFELDYSLKRKFSREYSNLYLSDVNIENMNFSNESPFNNSHFSNVQFMNCTFDLNAFNNSVLQNCTFFDCEFTGGEEKNFNDFALFACSDNNSFADDIIEVLKECDSNKNVDKIEITDLLVLEQFFGVGNLKPKAMKFSRVKQNLSNYSEKSLSKVISQLKSSKYLYFKDDVGFISKDGINYFNQHKASLTQ